MWWENTGCIIVINMLSDGSDVRPWMMPRWNEDTLYDKKRGWLCLEDESPVLGKNISRLIGFESIRDARRVKEIIARNIYDRLRQPVLEYITPEEFSAAACETPGVNGAVTVVQTPLFEIYGSVEWEEVEAKILKHPKDLVSRKAVHVPESNSTMDLWKDFMVPWDVEVENYKRYLEWLDRYENDNLKGIEDVFDDSRDVGGL